VAGFVQLGPVETAVHIKNLALLAAGVAAGLANQVAGLATEQRIITADNVDGGQLVPELLAQLGGVELHYLLSCPAGRDAIRGWKGRFR